MTCLGCARSARGLLGIAVITLILAGCARTATKGQIGFRVRSDFTAALNRDAGWAAGLNENATIVADQPFRIRFEISHGAIASPGPLRLQYRRNGGDWTDVAAHEFPYSDADDAQTPRVSIVTCHAYKNGEPTSDVLRRASAAFQAGAGVSLSDRTTSSQGASSHSEFEWAVVVRRYADGAVTNEQDDTFEFRMARASGGAFETSVNPVLPLSIPPGHLGGTFVETPGRIGPWRASTGHLYFIMEPAETDNVFMMMKSTDEGRTWREIDAANRPATDDLESVDARLVGDTIQIVHQVTESVRHHSFRTADHPTRPDTWAVRDEVVATVESIAQAATLVVRPDTSLVAFYVGETVRYSIRSPAGQWTPTKPIGPNLAGPQAVLGADHTVPWPDIERTARSGTAGSCPMAPSRPVNHWPVARARRVRSMDPCCHSFSTLRRTRYRSCTGWPMAYCGSAASRTTEP
jgi:hypothetical protein